MKKVLALIVTALISSTVSSVRADDDLPSLNDTENLGQRIAEYIESFKRWEAQEASSAAAQQGAVGEEGGDQPSFLEQFSALTSSILDREQLVGRAQSKLSATIAGRDNDRSVTHGLWRRLKSISSDSYASDPVTFNALIAFLTGTYYAQPEDREAIFQLLSRINKNVEEELKQSYHDQAVEWMEKGTMYGMTAIVLIDWRMYGKGGFARDLGAMGRGFKSALRSVARRVGKSPEMIQLAQEKPMRGIVASAAQATQEGVSQAIQRVRSDLGAVFTEPGKKLKAVPKKAMNIFLAHFLQLGKGFIVGGIPLGLYGLDEQRQPRKVAPLDSLKIMQAAAVLDLDVQSEALGKRIDRVVSDIVPSVGVDLAQLKAHEHDLLEIAQELKSIKDQYLHLKKAAPHLEGNLPWPSVASQVDDIRSRNWFSKIRSRSIPQDQVALFVADSEALSKQVQQIELKANQEAVRHGLQNAGEMRVSLLTIDSRLSAMEYRLTVLADGVMRATAQASAPAR